MTEKNVSVTVKTKNGTLVTLRADEPTELVNRIQEAIAASMESAVGALEELALTASVGSVAVAAQPVAQTPVEIVQQVFNATPVEESNAFAPVAPPAVPAPAGINVVDDRWGNKWTYGRSDAPVCPNGPMVLKQGTNQSGKSYAGWFDPAGGPLWQGQKVPSDQQTAPKWGVKV